MEPCKGPCGRGGGQAGEGEPFAGTVGLRLVLPLVEPSSMGAREGRKEGVGGSPYLLSQVQRLQDRSGDAK